MKVAVTRPDAPKQRVDCQNEFELCYLRHQYLRRVPYNPTQEEMQPYQKIIQKLCSRTYSMERYLFQLVGADMDDLLSAGNVFLVEYLGLFQLDSDINPEVLDKFIVDHQGKNLGEAPSPEIILSKNKANFTLFMKQRMEDLVRIFKQKAKNIKGFQVEEYAPFYGPHEPPSNLKSLLTDSRSLGFKKLDRITYKAIKRKVKAKNDEIFKWAGSWYVAVPLQSRNLTSLDLAGAGLDPYESIHNKTPEQLSVMRQDVITFEKIKKRFKRYSKQDKINLLRNFVEQNRYNSYYTKEIGIAERMLAKWEK